MVFGAGVIVNMHSRGSFSKTDLRKAFLPADTSLPPQPT